MAVRFPISARVTSTPHRDRCGREATRDAIFLLQVKRLNCISSDVDGIEMSDCETFRVTNRDDLPEWLVALVQQGDEPDDPGWISVNDFVQAAANGNREDRHGIQCVISHWSTESVWLDRDEAETYAKNHAYRWPDGWQVYSVCAEGALATMLRRQDSE